MTPNLAVIRVGQPHWWSLPIVLPLFLLWIPVLLLAPVALLVALLVSLNPRVPVWRALRSWWDLSCALAGMEVRVQTDEHRVSVRIV